MHPPVGHKNLIGVSFMKRKQHEIQSNEHLNGHTSFSPRFCHHVAKKDDRSGMRGRHDASQLCALQFTIKGVFLYVREKLLDMARIRRQSIMGMRLTLPVMRNHDRDFRTVNIKDGLNSRRKFTTWRRQ
jgi:hypothetical protein